MEYKSWYLVILGLVGLLCWTISYWRLFKRPQLVVPRKYHKKSLAGVRWLLFFVGVCGWISLSIALMQPRQALSHIKNNIEVNDIFFVLDVSGSMTATDFDPNRLEAAKRRILDFVGLKPTDRMGIVIFGAKAFTLMPLTTDLELIKRMVSQITIGLPGIGTATNIGDALGLASGRAAQSLAKNKVIVLLTDGASSGGTMTPIEAAKKVKKQGIKVYSIAMGSKKDAKMPYKDRFGRTTYRKIPGGSYDYETLKQISDITGGKSYIAHDESALKEVLDDINRLEKTPIEAMGRVVYKELYYLYLLVGALLIAFVEATKKLVLKEGV